MNNKTHSLRWNPPTGVAVKTRGVYILHGTGEHAARYAPLAMRLAQAGFRVGAHDHVGHGESAGARGVIDPPGSLITQAAIQCQQFALETGHAPVLFGHSLGGVAACELVLEHQLPVAGLILSAPSFGVHIRKRDLLLVKALSIVAPTYTVNRPYSASLLTQDETVRARAEADPLIHGVKSASLINWLITSGARQLENASQLDIDTLLLIAGDDRIADSGKTQQFAERAPADRITVCNYEDSYHEILNETPERSGRVLDDIEQWLLERFFE